MRIAVLIIACCLLSAAEFAEVFAWTAQRLGPARAHGRTLLQRDAGQQRAWLSARIGAANWGEAVLARSLLRGLERPAGLAEAAQLTKGARLGPAAAGRCAFAWDGDGGHGQAEFQRADAPLLAEILIECLAPGDCCPHPDPELVAAAGLLAEAACLGPLLAYAGETSSQELAAALAACAVDERAPLRAAVRDCPTQLARESDPARRRRREQGRLAAAALARLGDRETVPLLVTALATADDGPVIDAFALALGGLHDPRGVEPVYAVLLRHARTSAGSHGWGSDQTTYERLRAAMLALVDPAWLRARQHAASEAYELAILGGLLQELGDAPGMAAIYEAAGRSDWELGEPLGEPPAPLVLRQRGFEAIWRHPGWTNEDLLPPSLLLERAAVHGAAGDLRLVAALPEQPLAFPILARAVALGHGDESRLLAETFGERAVPALLARVRDQHESKDWADIGLAIGVPARPVMEAVLANCRKYHDPASERLVLAVLTVLDDPAQGSALLTHEDAVLRESAATFLARQRDPAALPALFVLAATRPALSDARDAGRQDRLRYRQRRDLLLGYGREVLLPFLAGRERPERPWREALLAEVLHLRLERPDLLATASAPRHDSSPYAMHGGPYLGHLRRSGQVWAERLGRDGIPLFEEAVAFGSELVDPGIAALALAVFAEPRSLRPIAEHMPDLGTARGGSVAAAALQAFGEAGARIVRDTPPPDPAKAAFGYRYSRHSAATEALAKLGDEDAVRAIVEGLRPPTEGSPPYWASRAKPYLLLAKGRRDPRILAAVLPLLDLPERSLDDEILAVLKDYDDPRIPAAALRCLARADADLSYDDTWKACQNALGLLARGQGLRLQPYLQELLRSSADPGLRRGSAWALLRLYETSPVTVGEEPTANGLELWSEAGLTDLSAVDARFTRGRTEAIGALLPAMLDADASVRSMAAIALASLSTFVSEDSLNGRTHVLHAIADRRAALPLATWLALQPDAPPAVLAYLAADGSAESLRAILAVYRTRERNDDRIAAALGHPGFVEAIPDLALGLRRSLADPQWSSFGELPALAAIGGDGPALVIATIVRKDAPMEARLRACAVGPAGGGWPRAAQGLWWDVLAAGPAGMVDLDEQARESGWYERLCQVAEALLAHAGAEGRRTVEAGLLRCRDDRAGALLAGILDAP